jgi:outer membrane immunogenic protein
MKKHRLGLLAFTLTSVGALAAANAADMYRAPEPSGGGYKDAPVYSSWSGFYVGVAGGGGWVKTSFDPINAPLNAKPSGGIFGGYAGYNMQFGSMVAGVEADFSGADIKKTVLGIGEKTDELGSVRGRLGYTVTPSLLAYGTAGFGWGHSTIDAPGFGSRNADQNGWVAGGGLEYKIFNNWIARAEYLHYDFGKEKFNFPVFFPPIMSETIDIVRGGVSYKFGSAYVPLK